jgi:hypothetical protein
VRDRPRYGGLDRRGGRYAIEIVGGSKRIEISGR